jgi:hypothetical protein
MLDFGFSLPQKSVWEWKVVMWMGIWAQGREGSYFLTCTLHLLRPNQQTQTQTQTDAVCFSPSAGEV